MLKQIAKAGMRTVGLASNTAYLLARYKIGQRQAYRAYQSERNRLFSQFLASASASQKRNLQISVKDEVGHKHGVNWLSVDKYDHRDFIDFHYDIHDLKFDDCQFDAVCCSSVLEHVPHPEIAIAELRRVLKPGGDIWVQLPFCYPYHESPKDYWRVSPDGLRIWMKAFEEIGCGIYYFMRSSLVSTTYYFGRKTRAQY